MYAKLLTEGIYLLETLAWSKAILFTLPFPYNKDILPYLDRKTIESSFSFKESDQNAIRTM